MFKTKTKTFIFVLEEPLDQDHGLEDYITAYSRNFRGAGVAIVPTFHQPPTNRFKQSFQLQVRRQADTVSWPEPRAGSSETVTSGPSLVLALCKCPPWQIIGDVRVCTTVFYRKVCTRPCTIMSTSTACLKSVNTTSYHWQMKFLQQQSDVMSLPSACDQAAC